MGCVTGKINQRIAIKQEILDTLKKQGDDIQIDISNTEIVKEILLNELHSLRKESLAVKKEIAQLDTVLRSEAQVDQLMHKIENVIYYADRVERLTPNHWKYTPIKQRLRKNRNILEDTLSFFIGLGRDWVAVQFIKAVTPDSWDSTIELAADAKTCVDFIQTYWPYIAE